MQLWQNVATDAFLPFRPSAVRYYRELGMSITDSLGLPN
jgi:hypothetical protein